MEYHVGKREPWAIQIMDEKGIRVGQWEKRDKGWTYYPRWLTPMPLKDLKVFIGFVEEIK